jgi:integrase/ribosomal protein L37E
MERKRRKKGEGAIYSYCDNCSTGSSLDAKVCAKCGTPFGKSRKYRVVVWDKGKRLTKVVANLARAREKEALFKADIIRGENNAKEKPKEAPRLSQVWSDYLRWAQIPGNKKTWITDKFNYEKHLEPRFGKKRVDAITAMEVNRLKLEMTKGKTKDGKPYLSKQGKPFSAATIKHQLVLLHRLYEFAKGPDFKYQGNNPFDHKQVKMPHLDNEITTFLTEDQLAALWQILEKWPNKLQAGFIHFALLTGVRRSTIFSLKWADVNFKQDMVTLMISHRRKGVETVIKKVSPEAMEVLKNLPRTSEYVFPGKDGGQRTDFKGPWLRVRKAAGLPDNIRFHDLRHNYASYHAMNGTPPLVIQKLLNHRDPRTTAKYSHLSPDVVHEAAALSGKLLTPKANENVVNLNKD